MSLRRSRPREKTSSAKIFFRLRSWTSDSHRVALTAIPARVIGRPPPPPRFSDSRLSRELAFIPERPTSSDVNASPRPPMRPDVGGGVRACEAARRLSTSTVSRFRGWTRASFRRPDHGRFVPRRPRGIDSSPSVSVGRAAVNYWRNVYGASIPRPWTFERSSDSARFHLRLDSLRLHSLASRANLITGESAVRGATRILVRGGTVARTYVRARARARSACVRATTIVRSRVSSAVTRECSRRRCGNASRNRAAVRFLLTSARECDTAGERETRSSSRGRYGDGETRARTACRPRLCFSMESALTTMAATSPSKVRRRFPFLFTRSPAWSRGERNDGSPATRMIVRKRLKRASPWFPTREGIERSSIILTDITETKWKTCEFGDDLFVYRYRRIINCQLYPLLIVMGPSS